MVLRGIIEKYKFVVLSLLLIAFSLSLRLIPPLDAYGLNMMEIDYIRWTENLSGKEFFINCIANHHGFLAPLIIDIALYIFRPENKDLFIRMISVIAFLALIITILLIKIEGLSIKERLFAIFFLSINSLLIAFSRNGRLLPLFVLSTFLVIIYIYKVTREKGLLNSILLFLFTLIALCVHPLSLIFITATILTSVILNRGLKVIRNLIPLFAAILSVSPYYIYLLKFGRVETELLPLNLNILKNWLLYLVDDEITLIVITFLLLISYSISEIKERLKNTYKKDIIRYFVINLLISLSLFTIISFFIPLTRNYYIIPLVALSSIILGSFISGLSKVICTLIVLMLSLKAIILYPILQNQIYRFHNSYGYEKEVLIKFRESKIYREIDLKNTTFLNLPIYHTRAFDYYRAEGEDYLPRMNRFGYLGELIEIDDIIKGDKNREYYLIVWEECDRLLDTFQRGLCNKNMKILDKLFIKEEVFKYNFYNKRLIKILRLKRSSNQDI